MPTPVNTAAFSTDANYANGAQNWTFDAGAANAIALDVWVQSAFANSGFALSWNGVSVPLLLETSLGGNDRILTFYLSGAASGSQTLALLFTGSARLYAVARSWSGAGAASNVIFRNAGGSNTSPRVNVNSTAGDLAVGVLFYDASQTVTPDGGVVERFDADLYGTRHAWAGEAPGAASVSVGGTTAAAVGDVGTGFSIAATGADTTPPTITGPGGATGATSSLSMPENVTAVHTFTANETVTWSLNGGADVARFSIGAATGALVFTAAPNFEAPADADANNTYVVGVRATDLASNATTQTLTVTIVNANEAPTFTGAPLANLTLTVGVAMTPIALAGMWTDPDAGDTLTHSAVGSFPPGITVASSQISGTPTAAGGEPITYSGLKVRATDGGNVSGDSTTFAITVNAAGSPPPPPPPPPPAGPRAGIQVGVTVPHGYLVILG